MKHKQDAIKEATNIIELHASNIKDQKVLVRTALITCEYSQLRDDSLKQRTLNYLRELVYGETIANELHDVEATLKKLRNRFYTVCEDAEYEDLRIQISKLEKEIENLTKNT